jgi:hypothetical protein
MVQAIQRPIGTSEFIRAVQSARQQAEGAMQPVRSDPPPSTAGVPAVPTLRRTGIGTRVLLDKVMRCSKWLALALLAPLVTACASGPSPTGSGYVIASTPITSPGFVEVRTSIDGVNWSAVSSPFEASTIAPRHRLND